MIFKSLWNNFVLPDSSFQINMKLREAGAVPAAASLYLVLYFNQGFLHGLVCVQSASADFHPAKTPSALNLAETDNSHLTTPQRSRGRRETALTLLSHAFMNLQMWSGKETVICYSDSLEDGHTLLISRTNAMASKRRLWPLKWFKTKSATRAEPPVWLVWGELEITSTQAAVWHKTFKMTLITSNCLIIVHLIYGSKLVLLRPSLDVNSQDFLRSQTALPLTTLTPETRIFGC